MEELKDIIYRIVLENRSNNVIGSLFEKANKLYCLPKEEMVIYHRIYNYSTYTRYIDTKITHEQFDAIVGSKYPFFIPVKVLGNEYSMTYEVNNGKSYPEALSLTDYDVKVDAPEDLVTYNNLQAYEKEMLAGSTPG